MFCRMGFICNVGSLVLFDIVLFVRFYVERMFFLTWSLVLFISSYFRYEPYLWENERQSYLRHAVLFGFFVQLNRLYTDTVQKLPTNSESNIMRCSTVPRFKYLPIRLISWSFWLNFHFCFLVVNCIVWFCIIRPWSKVLVCNWISFLVSSVEGYSYFFQLQRLSLLYF